MIKKLLLSISLLFGILTLVACNNNYNNKDKEITNLKQQVSQLEQENLELGKKLADLESKDTIQDNKIFFSKLYESIDGCNMPIKDDEYYIKYDNKIFISTQLIKDLFGMDDYSGIVIKGFPSESHIIRTDSIIKVQNIVNDLG